MTLELNYVIKFVSEMALAISFYRDSLGLALKFESPEWSEFVTGETIMALHKASDKNPAGTCQLGFGSDDLDALYAKRTELGLQFTASPTTQHGTKLARFLDCEGAECSVSG